MEVTNTPVMDRYQVYITDHPGDIAAVRVYDSLLKRILLTWRGVVAREIIDSGMLPFCVRAVGCHGCDKGMIQKLTLTATAISIALDQGEKPDELRRRLAQLDRRLPAFHQHIARLLFANPGKHFAHEEIVCLLTLQNPCACRERIDTHLDDLVAWEVVQKVVVGGDRVFYDINTEPHLHVFDPVSGELADAPSAGVLQAVNLHSLGASPG